MRLKGQPLIGRQRINVVHAMDAAEIDLALNAGGIAEVVSRHGVGRYLALADGNQLIDIMVGEAMSCS